MNALHAITVMMAAILKFSFSAFVSYQFGNNFWQTVLLIAAGGCLGAIFFFFAGASVLEWFRKRRVQKQARDKARGLAPKRIHTRTNKAIVRLKHGYGLQGLIFVAPPILSIPITALLAAKYFRHDRRTLPYLLLSVVAWSFVLSAAWKFTG